MVIRWHAELDHHVIGDSDLGQVCIRLDRAGLVTSIYLMFNNKEKLVPTTIDWTLDAAKQIAEKECTKLAKHQ